MHASAPTPVSLASLTGTWRRRWIRWPDGRHDAITSVWWVQAGRYFADLRLPAPGDATHSAEGFAGELVESHGIFHWRRDLDLNPTGKPDVGRLRYVDASRREIIEEGIEEPYVELWERIGSPDAPVALRLARGAAIHGWFIGAANHFIVARLRHGAELEVSYGRRDPTGTNGLVVASSDPRLQGLRAFTGDALSQGWTAA